MLVALKYWFWQRFHAGEERGLAEILIIRIPFDNGNHIPAGLSSRFHPYHHHWRSNVSDSVSDGRLCAGSNEKIRCRDLGVLRGIIKGIIRRSSRSSDGKPPFYDRSLGEFSITQCATLFRCTTPRSTFYSSMKRPQFLRFERTAHFAEQDRNVLKL